MNIPPVLLDLIKGNSKLYGCLLSTINNIEPLFKNSKMCFFPEYTDHGFDHVEMVIRTANNIINDKCRNIFSAQDAVVLIISCLLHDAAMHLTEDGFLELIKKDSRYKPLKGFCDKQWSILWENFLGEASRYDQRKLLSIFGDTDPVHRPNDDPQYWTKKERLLIGEFIRKYHGRLAHEIAIYGVPGPSSIAALELDAGLNDFRNLTGLVARSHSLPIRSCLDYLKNNFDLRDYKNCHAVFLMVLLRVSDYLHIDSERAPKEYLKIQKLRSPLSQKEWDSHHAIKNIHHNHDDPEAIYIQALPENADIYLKIKEWLNGIQTELDASWAVIGEIYGRFSSLEQLGIVIRRVRSNLDDVIEFSESIEYVPICAQFSTAGADLLKLLIGPLYGDRPEIGVRELLQNSIDAVIELNEISKSTIDSEIKYKKNNTTDIIISVSKDANDLHWFSIKDFGIGMTVDTIINYFLKAGASFRKSDLWRANYENIDHKSKIHRSGRFGVGALAAFLLGDEIEVTTRNFFSDNGKGLSFKATIDTDSINITHVNADIGTLIKIKIDKNTYDKLTNIDKKNSNINKTNWDWYCLNTLKVTRNIDTVSIPLTQQYLIPDCSADLPNGWNRIYDSLLSDVQWTYQKKVPFLTCNGIIIIEKSDKSLWRDKRYFEKWWGSNYWENSNDSNSYSIRMPNISVFDPDGNLPLNLQRNGLTTNTFHFQNELQDNVIKDILGYLLVNLPENIFEHGAIDEHLFKSHHPGLKIHGSWSPYFLTKNGYSFVDEWHISKIKPSKALMVAVYNKTNVNPILTNIISNADALFLFNVDNANTAISSFLRFIMGASLDYSVKILEKFKVCGRRVLLRKDTFDYFIVWRSTPKFLKKLIKKEWSNDKYILLQLGICHDDGFDFKGIADKEITHDDEKFPLIISEWYFTDNYNKFQTTPISQLWDTVIGVAEIPFLIEDRKRLLQNAYRLLDNHVESHEVNSRKKNLKSKQNSEQV